MRLKLRVSNKTALEDHRLTPTHDVSASVFSFINGDVLSSHTRFDLVLQP